MRKTILLRWFVAVGLVALAGSAARAESAAPDPAAVPGCAAAVDVLPAIDLELFPLASIDEGLGQGKEDRAVVVDFETTMSDCCGSTGGACESRCLCGVAGSVCRPTSYGCRVTCFCFTCPANPL